MAQTFRGGEGLGTPSIHITFKPRPGRMGARVCAKASNDHIAPCFKIARSVGNPGQNFDGIRARPVTDYEAILVK